MGGWSAAPISGVSHCRPKLLQVANLITLCHCPCVRRQQVFVLFVLVRPKYCAPISGALPAGGAVGCEVLVRGPGVDCKLLTLCHPAPAQRFAFALSTNLACPQHKDLGIASCRTVFLYLCAKCKCYTAFV